MRVGRSASVVFAALLVEVRQHFCEKEFFALIPYSGRAGARSGRKLWSVVGEIKFCVHLCGLGAFRLSCPILWV